MHLDHPGKEIQMCLEYHIASECILFDRLEHQICRHTERTVKFLSYKNKGPTWEGLVAKAEILRDISIQYLRRLKLGLYGVYCVAPVENG